MAADTISWHRQVDPAEATIRLDRYLCQYLTDRSRAEIQRWIKAGEVTVNSRPTNAHTALRAGDNIAVAHTDAARQPPDHWPAIRLIAETPDYLIVEKPAGILTQPAPNRPELALTDWLIERFPEIAQVGDDPSRPGLVHRLDRDVSGLLVIARTEPAFKHLKNEFTTRAIKKTYVALVDGELKDDGVIRLPIARSRTRPGRMAARTDATGRPASTAYEVTQYYRGFTLLNVHPETGRMHQIRVHLRALGHPIAGDRLYGHRSGKLTPDRLFLHAACISFRDRDGQIQEYQSPLPKELRAWLNRLDGKLSGR